MLKLKRTILCAATVSACVLSATLNAQNLYNFADLGTVKDIHMDPAVTAANGVWDEVMYNEMLDMLGQTYADMMYKDFYKQRLNHGGASFGAYYNNNAYGKSWHGFVTSSETNTSVTGRAGEFTAITGTGLNGSDNYMVYYGDGGGAGIINYTGPETLGIRSDNGAAISGIYVTNTVYAYTSMKYGDAYQKTPFQAGDTFTLTVKGYDAEGNLIGSTSVLLADGTDILDEWLFIDIESDIGGEIELLSFAFSQKTFDNKSYIEHGCKVPIYVAVGGIEFSAVVPEPATYALLFGGLCLCVAVGRRNKKAA